MPVGGGGLLAGCAVAAKGIAPPIRVWGVEPETGDDVRRSLEIGERVSIPVPRTIADGLQTTAVGRAPFEVLRSLCDGIDTMSDTGLVEAMRFLFERMKLVVEPSGAAGVAALLAGKLDVAGRRVGVVLSGGNVSAQRFAELVENDGVRSRQNVRCSEP